VQDESGAGIADVVVLCEASASEAVLTDPKGHFACAAARAGVVQNVRLLTAWQDRVVEPAQYTGVTPGGPPLRFVVREGQLTIRGRVDTAILDSLRGEQTLQVSATDALGHRTSRPVRPDGRFSLMVRESGPHVVALAVLDASGQQLQFLDVTGVAAICGVVPGSPPIAFGAAPR
jgi:hypothetical protein